MSSAAEEIPVPGDRSAEWFTRASAVTPGGVNSPVRAFGSVGGTPRFIASATGPYLTDVDGHEYVDLVCSWGPMILGHAYPAVVSALEQAARRGTSFGAATPGEVELAEEIAGRTPVEKVRLVNSGTEATMSALRLARGFTGRPLVVKFAGCYHGHVDALLAAAGSGVATFALPDSPGVTGASASRHDRAALQRRSRGPRGVRRPRRPDRRRDHRGLPGQHGRRTARTRIQRNAARRSALSTGRC